MTLTKDFLQFAAVSACEIKKSKYLCFIFGTVVSVTQSLKNIYTEFQKNCMKMRN